MNMASFMTLLSLSVFAMVGVDCLNATRKYHKALKLGFRWAGDGDSHDDKAYDAGQCQFVQKNHWCWVEGEQRQWIMDFLNKILTEDKPKQLLKYQVRIKPEPPGLKGGWQMLVKYVAEGGSIIYGLFFYPWLPNDKYSKGFEIENWSTGQKAKDDRPWPE